MSNSVKTRRKNPFKVNLDGEITTLPGRSLESMLGMFAHLENLALRRSQDKNYTAIHPNTKKTALPKYPALEAFGAIRVSFRDLGRQVVRAAKGQVRSLRDRAMELESLVLINNWKIAEKLWDDFIPDCKTPLYELNFLEELWGVKDEDLDIQGWTLTRHWQQFVLLQAEIEVLLARRQNVMHLSDVLAERLGLWLRRFEEILEKLDEYSVR